MKMKTMFVATMIAGALSTTGMAQAPTGAAGQAPGQPGTAGGTQPTDRPSAQTTRDSNNETTMQGCLEKNKSGGYWLTKAMPSRGPASGSGAVGTTGTATPGAAGTAGASNTQTGAGMVYNLEEVDGKVGSTDLDKHVGHKVEVTGRVDDTKSGDKLKRNDQQAPGTATDREIDAQDFHISAIKMIAASCS